jgi:hypothetical protein
MGLNKLIEAAFVVIVVAAVAGQIPRLVQTLRVAQLQLLKESQSSKWGQAMLLPVRK